MAGSSYGNLFKITTWGESHGDAVGVAVDGCPAGLKLDRHDIQKFLDRRKPGGSDFSTQRKENDEVRILSGVFGGMTTGTPVLMLIENKDQRSKDYERIRDIYRPGHADYTYDMKYGFRDYRGGGRASARETAGRVAAGALAVKLLERIGIHFLTYTKSIGPVAADDEKFDEEEINRNPLYMPDADAAVKAKEYLREKMAENDSAGGVIECVVTGVPAGIGEPVFDKLDACLAKAVMSIGAVKGVEIGDGFSVSEMTGKTDNDGFTVKDGKIIKTSNHAGGITGGISDGSPIVLRAALKPTPSISGMQKTVTADGRETDVEIKGRHDPVIVPRAVAVVEAMTAVTLADMALRSMTSRMDRVEEFFKNR